MRRGVQPRQHPARGDPGGVESPRSRCACSTRTPCSRRRSSASPAAGRSGGSISSSAPTVATWPPPCRQSTTCQGPPVTGYAVVWDLRSPSTPTRADPDRHGRPRGGPQPGRPTPLHERAVDGVRRRDGRADLAAPARRVELRVIRHQRRGDPARAGGAGRQGRAPGGCRGRRTRSTRLRGHKTTVCDIRFSPDGSLVGSVAADGELIVWDAATGRLVERWGSRGQRGASASARTTTWSTAATALDAAHLGPVAGGHLSAADAQVGDAEAFRQADFSPDGQQVAYRWRDDQGRGWVRFVDHRHRSRHASSPIPGCGRAPGIGPTASGIPAGAGTPGTGARTARAPARRPAQSPSSTPPPATPSGKPQTLSSATPTSGPGVRRRRPEPSRLRLRARGQHRRRRDPSPPGRAVRPLRFLPVRCDPDRGRDHRAGLGLDRSGARARACACSTSTPARSATRKARWTCWSTRPLPLRTARASLLRATPARSSPSTSRPDRRSGDPPASVPRCTGSTTPTMVTCWSPARRTAGSACGMPPRSTTSARCTHPTGGAGPSQRAVHRRQPRRGDRVVRRQGLPVGDRPRPRTRPRLPDGRTRPDRTRVGAVPARPALPVRLPRRVRGGPVPASTLVSASDWAAEKRVLTRGPAPPPTHRSVAASL